MKVYPFVAIFEKTQYVFTSPGTYFIKQRNEEFTDDEKAVRNMITEKNKNYKAGHGIYSHVY